MSLYLIWSPNHGAFGICRLSYPNHRPFFCDPKFHPSPPKSPKHKNWEFNLNLFVGFKFSIGDLIAKVEGRLEVHIKVLVPKY